MDPLSSVITALKTDHIIPDVVPENFNPTLLFSIVYPGGREVLLGNEFTVEETTDEPSIDFTPLNMPTEQAASEDAGDEVSYTLAMVDPDAPTRAEPTYRSFRHWLITGLKSPRGTASKTSDLSALQSKAATTPYRPPGPRPKSGIHRYTFLLFQEPRSVDGFSVPEGSPEYGAALEERRSWDAVKFADKYGLKLVGANFMLIRAVEET
ncbi:phosphatidylethanolamine-binding protein [Abortiporus biennis]|nr:phosphatidylethanolamine-binding protein [Abortiporus biennis]